jgi:hypothetical protein
LGTLLFYGSVMVCVIAAIGACVLIAKLFRRSPVAAIVTALGLAAATLGAGYALLRFGGIALI